jgi:hypothetical protein
MRKGPYLTNCLLAFFLSNGSTSTITFGSILGANSSIVFNGGLGAPSSLTTGGASLTGKAAAETARSESGKRMNFILKKECVYGAINGKESPVSRKRW